MKDIYRKIPFVDQLVKQRYLVTQRIQKVWNQQWLWGEEQFVHNFILSLTLTLLTDYANN